MSAYLKWFLEHNGSHTLATASSDENWTHNPCPNCGEWKMTKVTYRKWTRFYIDGYPVQDIDEPASGWVVFCLGCWHRLDEAGKSE